MSQDSSHDPLPSDHLTGTVQWFSDANGYGFIRNDWLDERLYVHSSSILGDGFRTLSEGDRVAFRLGSPYNGTPSAVDVRRISHEAASIWDRPAAIDAEFARARDELRSHIQRCGVYQAEPDIQLRWLEETLDYLSERFPNLSSSAMDRLRSVGIVHVTLHGSRATLPLAAWRARQLPPAPLRVLFLAANPHPTRRLELDEEIRLIELRLRGSLHRDYIALKSRWALRAEDLLDALNAEAPDIVHFSGHGDQDGICLVDESGGILAVSGVALRDAFASAGKGVRLVVLNSCFSESQATEMVEGVGAVIAMRRQIGDVAARRFSAAFYGALGYGCSLLDSFAQGLALLGLQGMADASVPQLLLAEGRAADDIFLNYAQDGPIKRERAEADDWKVLGSAGSLVPTAEQGRTFLVDGVADIVNSGRWLAVALVDIDDLGIINKRYGEPIGDRVIQAVDALVRSTVPGAAFAGRCGDDTFCIAQSGTAAATIEEATRLVLGKVASYPWSDLAVGLWVSCSAGWAIGHAGQTGDVVASRAALGMQHAKRQGRGRPVEGPSSLDADTSRDPLSFFS